MIDYLRLVTEWVTKNKLVLNVGKMKSLVIGSRFLVTDEPALVLEIENIPVEQVYETKRLDIIVDQRGLNILTILRVKWEDGSQW